MEVGGSLLLFLRRYNMLKKFVNFLKNKFNKKDTIEEMCNYKKGEEVIYDEEVFNWFFNSD